MNMSTNKPALLFASSLCLSSIFLVSGAAQDAEVKDGLTQEQLEQMTTEILKDIEEMRGEKFKRPVDVSLANKEGFLKYATERMETMSTPERLRSEETVMKMMGLVDPKVDYLKAQMEMLEEQVGGFYDPATESFCLMESFQGGLAKVILAHELTHALDDQLYDIDGTLEGLDGNADAQLAYQAVVEGSGTSNMNKWLLANLGSLSMEEIAASGDLGMDSMAAAPECMWKPTLMVYMHGAAFLVRSDNVMVGQMKAVEAADLHQVFTNPPRSTEQVLHPEKYWDKEQADEPVVVKLSAEKLEGWKVLFEDTIGEAILALMTTPPAIRGGLDVSNPMSLLSIKYTNPAAEGWGGDRYLLLVLAMHLVTTWDTAPDATEFRASILSQSDHLRTAWREGGPEGLLKVGSASEKQVVVTIVTGAPEGFDVNEIHAGVASIVAEVEEDK
jgi:hypothetical protein